MVEEDVSVRCVTWNVHRAKGTDGRRDTSRVEAVIAGDIATEKPDVLALQEADEECRPHERIFDTGNIERATGLGYAHDSPDLRWGPESSGFLGTILFLSRTFRRHHADVIDLPGHCHRGAIALEADFKGKNVRLMSAHLSLSQPLRIMQMRILGQYLRRRPPMQTIFLGDMNEWRPWRGLTFHDRLVGTRFRGPTPASFPSTRPFLPLDRILTDKGALVQGTRVLKTPETRVASDHLPVFAQVTVL